MRGDFAAASHRLELACQTNPRAVGGFFLRSFVAWKQGAEDRAIELLKRAAKARGDEWKPEGAVAEGDVARRMYREVTPLSRFWEAWDGSPDPQMSFTDLEKFLESVPCCVS